MTELHSLSPRTHGIYSFYVSSKLTALICLSYLDVFPLLLIPSKCPAGVKNFIFCGLKSVLGKDFLHRRVPMSSSKDLCHEQELLFLLVIHRHHVCKMLLKGPPRVQ